MPKSVLGLLVVLAVLIPTIQAQAIQQKVPILLYHRVNALPLQMSKAMRRFSLSIEQFKAQMEWVRQHQFQPVTMQQVVEHMQKGIPLPLHSIALTFDDGYKEQYKEIFPILQQFHYVGTFFIITDMVGHSAYMNWKQISALSNAGMDIEAHTLTHPNLSALSHHEATLEIEGSKKILEKHLQRPVTILAYPYGRFNEDTIAITKNAGFKAAAKVEGFNLGYMSQSDASYTIERYCIEYGDSLDYLAQVKGFNTPIPAKNERALFVSVIQDPPVLASKKAINELIDFANQAKIKVLFVQVYHSAQAWFPTNAADDSHYQEIKRAVGEDPLTLLIRQAHMQGIQIHAWLNLMSLGNNSQAFLLRKYGTDILTCNLVPKTKMEDFKIDNQYFLEPGDPRVRDSLNNIVTDLLMAYPALDGIQFDYIRYPDVHPHYGYTKANMERFKKAYGLSRIDENSEEWKDWKRQQVTEVLKQLVSTIRTLRPGMQVSTTGCMPYMRAYAEAYQDWPTWLRRGLIDFVTIMDYSTDPQQFKRWIDVIKQKTGDLSKVKIAVGAYKTLHTPQIFEKEYESCEKMGAGCAVFHYGSLLESKELNSFLKHRI